MLLDQIRKYSRVIDDFDVERFRKESASFQLIASVRFTNRSNLYLKDYLFRDETRKYAYHWQSHEEELIIRWDNAPHWKKIKTHPHHKHVRRKDNVMESDVRSIRDVFRAIYDEMDE